MEAYRRVYDSRHLQVDCQEPGSALKPPTLCNLVWATFIIGTKKSGTFYLFTEFSLFQ